MPLTIDLSAYGKQHSFLMDQHRFVGFIGGISTGKTNGGIKKAIKKALEFPGCHGTITAPTYTMLHDTTYRTFREVCPPELIAWETKQPMDVGLYTPQPGKISEVHFRSTHDPESLRGPNLLWGFMDEASLSSRGAYEIMLGRIRAQPGPAQQLWVTTTPKGLNWVFDEFGPTQAAGDLFSVYFVETKDNPFNTPEFIESIYRLYKGEFAAQELSAQFVAAKGLIYASYFNQAKHVLSRERSREVFGNDLGYFEDIPCDIAWDFGYPNPSALLVFQQDARGRVFVVDELYRYRTLEEDMLAELRSKPYFGNITDGLGDSARPDTIDRLSNLGLPIRPVEKGRILDGINKVRSLLAIDPTEGPKVYFSYRCENTFKEIAQYRWADQRSDTGEYSEKPIGAYDHALDAFRYWVEDKWAPLGAVTDKVAQATRRLEQSAKRRTMMYQYV